MHSTPNGLAPATAPSEPLPEARQRSRATHRARLVRAELARLTGEIAAWCERREQLDTLQMFRTQLRFLREALRTALAAVDAELAPGALLRAEAREIYARSRTQQLRLAWIERLWLYFKRKFDQRDLPSHAATLLTAYTYHIGGSC